MGPDPWRYADRRGFSSGRCPDDFLHAPVPACGTSQEIKRALTGWKG
jgi:hypothetical protein